MTVFWNKHLCKRECFSICRHRPNWWLCSVLTCLGILRNPKPHENTRNILRVKEMTAHFFRVFLVAHSCTQALFKPSISYAPRFILCTSALGTTRRVCFAHNISVPASWSACLRLQFWGIGCPFWPPNAPCAAHSHEVSHHASHQSPSFLRAFWHHLHTRSFEPFLYKSCRLYISTNHFINPAVF